MGHLDNLLDDAKRLKTLAKEICELKPYEQLPEVWQSSLNYDDDVELVETYQSLFWVLERSELTPTTTFQGDNLVEHLEAARSNLWTLDSFCRDPEKGSRKDYDQAIAAIVTHLRTNEFRKRLSEAVAQQVLGNGFDAALREVQLQRRGLKLLEEKLEYAITGQDQRTVKFEKQVADAEDTVAGLKSVLQLAIIRKESELFRKEASWRFQESWAWLLFLVAASVLVGWYAYDKLPGELLGKEEWEMVPVLASRTTLLSLAFFGLVFISRNYSACRHNFTVNKHREHALNTFQHFVNSCNDDHVKNAVLLETTKVIFSPTATGYLKSASDSTSGNQVVEIISGAISTKDK